MRSTFVAEWITERVFYSLNAHTVPCPVHSLSPYVIPVPKHAFDRGFFYKKDDKIGKNP